MSTTTINPDSSRSPLFIMCCLALLVTAMTFAIRAGILGQLGNQFNLSDTQLGWINAMAFLGFPLATLFGGAVYNFVGPKKLLQLAFVCHLLGLGLTISASGFWSLLISTLFIGFANGSVEAACNPLIADIYRDRKTTMLNRFHVWFPGGIVVGALCSKFMTDAGLGWQLQIAIMIVPTLAYGLMLLQQSLPRANGISHSTSENIKALFSPLFLFMVLCMTLTATTELGTQQWIDKILGASGASPMLILAMITGLMAIGRFFAGPLINRFNPVGVLLLSAIFACAGIYSMSIASGAMVYISAIVFALGVTYFWPTMLGFVAENIPQSGALGLSLMGGAGMFAVSLWNPVIGGWIDSAREQASQMDSTNIELLAGQAVLSQLVIFPAVLIIAFAALAVFRLKQKQAATV